MSQRFGKQTPAGDYGAATIFLLYVSLFPVVSSLWFLFLQFPCRDFFFHLILLVATFCQPFSLPLWLPACLNSSFLNTYNHIPELKGKTLHRSLLREGQERKYFRSWLNSGLWLLIGSFLEEVTVFSSSRSRAQSLCLRWFCISYMTHTSVDGNCLISKELPAGAWVLRLTIALELSAENLIIKPKSQKHKHSCFCL